MSDEGLSCLICLRKVTGPRAMPHDPDCPGRADSRIGQHEALVRELAEWGPIIYDGITCMTCREARPDPGRDFERPENHDPACLWRRARALYPGRAGGSE
jgi:hypothetical protein